ncbi:hypothetical protein [Bordetella genomosp. 1]|uniref:hypothetical protein n=1 Tax=Bordetella genomosp. 1 TaxID=1395607 RepID=UPI0015960BB9|nr:hypothetical protein [Bordetella genomosp. 1]
MSTQQEPRRDGQDAPQKNDTDRTEQQSHGSEQNRSKKDGHTSQIGTGGDQQSSRNTGGGARRP